MGRGDWGWGWGEDSSIVSGGQGGTLSPAPIATKLEKEGKKSGKEGKTREKEEKL